MHKCRHEHKHAYRNMEICMDMCVHMCISLGLDFDLPHLVMIGHSTPNFLFRISAAAMLNEHQRLVPARN